jgi:Na+-translocating ferredoxin:NAD+ oxidoreductase subunit B
MNADVYRKLAEHLDRLPGGFAPSETGADLRLLQGLFTPEEAELAIHLTLEREETQVVAARAGLPIVEAQQRLDAMAHKGLIFSVHPEAGPALYQAAPWVVGIYEFQVNRLSRRFMRDLGEYYRSRTPRPRLQTIPQMRTIPIGESIAPNLAVLPHEQVGALIATQERFAVAPCICRHVATLSGAGCDAPKESCLIFGEWADFYVQSGRGRAIDRAEVLEILARADAANLVLQPNNAQDVAFICCCCGCCCGVLKGLQHEPKPAEAVVNAFIAHLDAEACQGCWICLERCQMGALAADGDRVTLNADRCIGCGLCVSTCPSGALTLVRKPTGLWTHVPASLDDTWRIIEQAQDEMR